MSSRWLRVGMSAALLAFSAVPGCGSGGSRVASHDVSDSGSRAELGGGGSDGVVSSSAAPGGGSGASSGHGSSAAGSLFGYSGAASDDREAAEVYGDGGSGEAGSASAGQVSLSGMSGVSGASGASGVSGVSTGGAPHYAGASGAGGVWAGNGGTASTGNGGSAGAVASLMVPCDAYAVFANVCQHCHADPPLNDAPFALVSYQEIKAMARALSLAVSNGQMPKAPESLTLAQQTTLLTWLETGANGVPSAACP